MSWLPIRYRDFWDVPRIFFAEDGGSLCQFNETLEDYPESYQLFLMPPLAPADYAGSWANLWQRAMTKVGDVPISGVRFDPTRRAADVFDAIRAPVPQLNGATAHARPEYPVT